MTDLERRVERLEGTTNGGPVYAVAIRAANETTGAAMARYRAEHPETPANAELIVFVSGFSIAERDPIP
jgi:hypothetical protein